jgi:hypothetical protein
MSNGVCVMEYTYRYRYDIIGADQHSAHSFRGLVFETKIFKMESKKKKETEKEGIEKETKENPSVRLNTKYAHPSSSSDLHDVSQSFIFPPTPIPQQYQVS